MPVSSAERDGDTVLCHRPDRQLVVSLGNVFGRVVAQLEPDIWGLGADF